MFKGSGVALVTPFKGKEVNYKVLEELLEFQIANKTDAIIVTGTTGESATLSEEEKEEIYKFTVGIVKGRVPVIAGTGCNDTDKTVKTSITAEKAGVDGLLIVTPYYNKPTQRGLEEHFTQVAKRVDIPIILYNVPSRTGVNLLPETVERLANISSIVGLKEASGDIGQIAEISRRCSENIDIYSGNDDQIVPIMALGGKGVISVLANICPRETHDMCWEFLNGNIKESRYLQLKYLPLIKNLFIEANPIPVKEALNLMGFDVGSTRLPLVDMEITNKEKLAKTMKELGMIGG